MAKLSSFRWSHVAEIDQRLFWTSMKLYVNGIYGSAVAESWFRVFWERCGHVYNKLRCVCLSESMDASARGECYLRTADPKTFPVFELNITAMCLYSHQATKVFEQSSSSHRPMTINWRRCKPEMKQYHLKSSIRGKSTNESQRR